MDRERDALEQEVMEMFTAWRNPVLRYLAGIGLEIHDAEEIAQEVFLALFQHLGAGKSRRNLRGWVFRVAHNLGLRRRERAQERGELPALADPSPNPEDQFLSAQRNLRILAVVGALPEQDRACLDLRAEGLRYREIAQVLGMSLGAVSMSLARSMARIARAAER
ncbi:MAG TPA: sigma-70 family RNA polymerase sigma factor [Bryobacteraceae bacterium]|nr:sigma-70 family RNA polymerase sigma factor [Bryobacteraceae bacterium]